MRKVLPVLIFAVVAMLVFCGCASQEYTCDHCGKVFSAPADENMTEDWIIFCGDCNEKLFEGDPLLDPDIMQ